MLTTNHTNIDITITVELRPKQWAVFYPHFEELFNLLERKICLLDSDPTYLDFLQYKMNRIILLP